MEGVALRLFNVLRAGPGAVEPLYRRAGDLRLAPAQRRSARWCSRTASSGATSSMCEDVARGVPAGARPSGGSGRGVQHRQRPATSRSREVAPAMARAMGAASGWPGNRRQGAGRRHPPLFRRHRPRARRARLRAATRSSTTAWANWPHGSARQRAVDLRGAGPARAGSSGGWSRDGAVDPRAGHRRRRLHRLQPRRPAGRARATMSWCFDSLVARPAWPRTWRGCGDGTRGASAA